MNWIKAMKKLLLSSSVLLVIGGLFIAVFFNNKNHSGLHNASKAEYIVPLIDPSLIQSTNTQNKQTTEPLLNQQEQAELEAYLKQLAAGSEIKGQLEKLQNSGGEEQEQLADHLLEQVDDFFEQKQISHSEALFLKLAVMKHVLSPENFKEYANHEIASHEQTSRQKWQHYLSNRDPQFLDYKQKERELVERIMQMDSFPDGLTRDQYLRQEIEKLKAKAYGFDKVQEG